MDRHWGTPRQENVGNSRISCREKKRRSSSARTRGPGAWRVCVHVPGVAHGTAAIFFSRRSLHGSPFLYIFFFPVMLQPIPRNAILSSLPRLHHCGRRGFDGFFFSNFLQPAIFFYKIKKNDFFLNNNNRDVGLSG